VAEAPGARLKRLPGEEGVEVEQRGPGAGQKIMPEPGSPLVAGQPQVVAVGEGGRGGCCG